VQALVRRLEDGGALSGAGICAPAQPFLTALIHKLLPHRPIVAVAPDLKTQEIFQQDIETWLASSQFRVPGSETLNPEAPTPNCFFYPAWEILTHEGKLPHADVISERLQTLVALQTFSDSGALRRRNQNSSQDVAELRPPIVVTNVVALLQKTLAPEDLKTRTRRLRRGDKIAPLDLMDFLEAQGYEPEAQVSQKGDLARRGGIVDAFPPTSPWPVRLEFFGDELESLREFDPLTQLALGEISEVIFPPAGEIGILKKWQATSDKWREGRAASGQQNIVTCHLSPVTLLDHVPRETLFVLCEPESLQAHAENYAQQIPPDDPFYISWPDFLAELNRRSVTTLELVEETESVRDDPRAGIRDLQFDSLDAHRPLAERALEPQIAELQRREFFHQLHRWLRQDYKVHVFCNNDGERQRFEEIWAELGLGSGVLDPGKDSRSTQPQTPESKPQTRIGSLARGFICDEAKLVVVTDAEIFGRYKIQRPRKLKSPHALAARSALDIDFTDLEEGDLVVHLQHGIGRYLGLKNLPLSSRAESPDPGRQNPDAGTECLVIEYAPSGDAVEPPKLYVPLSESHLVSKYVGAGGRGASRPPLNTLGGTRWQKAKEQTERAVRDVAAELLRIQAARETQPGHGFKSDSPWQREFESAFIYEETPDQITAIADTKSDMEKPKPMDRLICGDVGFGKTEVAIRAAFKAVMDGKQVAVLVPTTVLAQQHFNNFRERMADYPVRIELLSRFRSRREQQKVVGDLASGAVDIVIGTHRLLQEDIAFKDLGLVVIDEEQRFGVLHKEKFKRLRTLVDVLTLSATPIPRTLYLALTGARDMSTIQTPPHDRLPVETIATAYDERLIRDAIQRELNRGGQVFFLHNRVMTIDTMRSKLQMLVPHARVVVGHGQMNSDELEEVMTKFVNGEADVLLSTTIIESGLDIPNANTIIIDRADRFGLSDLYQLRGRVGRYKHQAYAYLLLPRHARLLTDVRKRISAIRQYATLGSGFKIAMRDLEIRGAGNLLGAEQSGHITAVGFELYCQLLKQSVSSLKGEKVKPRVEVSVKLDFLGAEDVMRDACSVNVASRITHHASLPHSYVTEPQHRIEIYRKMAQATDKSALEHLQKEMRDRFGPLPPPVELLLQIAELKILAADKSVTVIEVEGDKLKLTRQGDFITLGGKFPRLTKKEAKARLKEIKRLLLAI
jgi:transcription-repair coupling factor (superfamily II helicase)